MRILLLNYEYPPLGGGAGVAMRYLLEGLSRKNDVYADLITSSMDKAEVAPLRDSVNIHYLDIGKSGAIHYQSNRELITYALKSYRYAKRLLQYHSYDCVHAFFGIPCGYIAGRLNLPYIVSLRGSDVPFYNKRFEKLDKLLFQRMSRRIWQRAAFVVANSEGLKRLALASAPDQEIDVIYNGVDTELFTPRAQMRRQGRIVLVSTGRLIERKGYRFLIEALAGQEDFELRLVGDGNLRESLESMARQVKAHVVFLGKKSRDEVMPILQGADLFVLPSLNEGMSNSLLEAIACGLPVVVTDVGGSSELVSDNGFIVEKGSSAALREALLKYRHNPTLLAEQGRTSRQIAMKMSWRRMSDRYLALYERTCNTLPPLVSCQECFEG